jgi:signal peptidase I
LVRHFEIFVVIEEALTNGTTVRFRAEGISMHPAIRDGEAITIAPVVTDDVVSGDVLLCRHGERVLAHRVVGVTTCGTERFFELRGDANTSCDTPIGAGFVVGKVVGVRRNGRLVPLCGQAARQRFHARAVAAHALLLIATFRSRWFTGIITSVRG